MVVQQLDLSASSARSGIVMAGHRGSRWQLFAKLSNRRVQRLGGAAFGPRIAVGADGTAVAAWLAGRSLRAAIARPGHGFGAPRTLGRAPSDIPVGVGGILPGGVVVGDDGTGVIGWTHGAGGTSEARVTFTRGSGFTAAQTLGDSYFPPAVARAPDGTVAVTWLTRLPMPKPGDPPPPVATPQVMVATAAAGARVFGPPTALVSPPALLSPMPPDAFTGPGGAAIRWSNLDIRRIAVLRSAGVIETAELGGARSNDTEYDDPISLALPADSTLLAVWRYVRIKTTEGGQRPLGSQVLAAIRPPGGAFSAPQPLSDLSGFADTPAVASVPRGTLVAWRERAPRGRSRVRVRVYDGTTWTAPTTVTTADSVSTVQLAAAGRSAAIVWTTHARVILDRVG
jgi:hypothetical protein